MANPNTSQTSTIIPSSAYKQGLEVGKNTREHAPDIALGVMVSVAIGVVISHFRKRGMGVLDSRRSNTETSPKKPSRLVDYKSIVNTPPDDTATIERIRRSTTIPGGISSDGSAEGFSSTLPLPLSADEGVTSGPMSIDQIRHIIESEDTGLTAPPPPEGQKPSGGGNKMTLPEIRHILEGELGTLLGKNPASPLQQDGQDTPLSPTGSLDSILINSEEVDQLLTGESPYALDLTLVAPQGEDYIDELMNLIKDSVPPSEPPVLQDDSIPPSPLKNVFAEAGRRLGGNPRDTHPPIDTSQPVRTTSDERDIPELGEKGAPSERFYALRYSLVILMGEVFTELGNVPELVRFDPDRKFEELQNRIQHSFLAKIPSKGDTLLIKEWKWIGSGIHIWFTTLDRRIEQLKVEIKGAGINFSFTPLEDYVREAKKIFDEMRGLF